MLDKIKNFLNIPEIDEDEDDFYEDDYEDEEYTPRTSRRDTMKSSASRQIQQKQSSSRGYSNIIGGSPVVVNLEGFDSTEAQRIMDFICGCIHALDGTLSQISNYIFIFAPSGVDIHGDISIDTDSVPVFNKK